VTELPWDSRPVEERAALNPAFLALLMREAARGFRSEDGLMPIPLAFVMLPLVLHRPSREALPRQVRTSLPIWIQEHQFLREGFPGRVRAIATAGREALAFGVRSGGLRITNGALEVGDQPRTPGRATAESRDVLARAFFVGRWLARSGDVATIYYLWGIRP
jgi:hypothetical protein